MRQRANVKPEYERVDEFGWSSLMMTSPMLTLKSRAKLYPSEHMTNWDMIRWFATAPHGANLEFKEWADKHGYWMAMKARDGNALALYANIFMHPVHVYYPHLKVKEVRDPYTLGNFMYDFDYSREPIRPLYEKRAPFKRKWWPC